MTLDPAPFLRRLWSVRLPLVALLLICTLVGLAAHKNNAALATWEGERNRLIAARRQLNEVDLEKARIDESIRMLAGWRARGVIGTGNRLAWIDTIQTAARSLGIHDMRFRFENSNPVADASPKGAHWQASTMHLSINGIDEVRLLQFLERITAEASAEVIVRRCDMRRAPNAQEVPASLSAECVLDWFFITLRADRT